RIEVAMGTETNHPVVLLVENFEEAAVNTDWARPSGGVSYSGALVGCCRDGAATSDEASRRIHAIDSQVRDVNTQIEVLGHVPLSARANKPPFPVVLAANCSSRETARAVAIMGAAGGNERTAYKDAKDVIGWVVVVYLIIAAIE